MPSPPQPRMRRLRPHPPARIGLDPTRVEFRVRFQAPWPVEESPELNSKARCRSVAGSAGHQRRPDEPCCARSAKRREKVSQLVEVPRLQIAEGGHDALPHSGEGRLQLVSGQNSDSRLGDGRCEARFPPCTTVAGGKRLGLDPVKPGRPNLAREGSGGDRGSSRSRT